MPNLEDAKWAPEKVGRRLSVSVKLLRSIQVGEVKRLNHEDLSCHKTTKGNYACSLQQQLYRLKKDGCEFETYHEDEHICVIRRNR